MGHSGGKSRHVSPAIQRCRNGLALSDAASGLAEFDRQLAQARWAYPLGGLAVLAYIRGLWYGHCNVDGRRSHVGGSIYLAAMVFMSGAMHEDGLADTADGFWGGWDAGAAS